MDPLSLLVGAVAGACLSVVIMSLMRMGDGYDDEPPVETQFQDEPPLIRPDDRNLH